MCSIITAFEHFLMESTPKSEPEGLFSRPKSQKFHSKWFQSRRSATGATDSFLEECYSFVWIMELNL